MTDLLIDTKKRLDKIEKVLSNILLAATALFIFAILAFFILNKIGHNKVDLREHFNEFTNLLLYFLTLNAYGLVPWILLISVLCYFPRRKKFTLIHKKYELIKFPYLETIKLTVLFMVVAVYYTMYARLFALIVEDHQEQQSFVCVIAYFLTVVFVSFYWLNFFVEKKYFILSEKLIEQDPKNEELILKISLGHKQKEIRFEDSSVYFTDFFT